MNKLGAGISTGNQLCPPVSDVREVERVVNQLSCAIDRYENLAAKLSIRLDCVVSPVPPICEQTETTGYCTSLAATIDCSTRRLRNITNDLESLYERIEL